MKIRELHKLLSEALMLETYEENTIAIALQSPHIGPSAWVALESVELGFDWNKGKIILHAAKPIVLKTEKEEAFDLAHSYLRKLARSAMPNGKPTTEAKLANEILEKAKERTK